MKRPIILFLLCAGLAASPGIHAQQTDEGRDTGLALTIQAEKKDNGRTTIDLGGTFTVLIKNESKNSIRLWKEGCFQGYATLSFAVSEEGGRTWIMKKTQYDPSYRERNPPETIEIPPGSVFRREVGPKDFSYGRRAWTGVPEPNTGKDVTLTAVFEIEESELTKSNGVWTGRVSSPPVKLRFVNPKLRTPLEYLWEQCPEQALRIMKADPTWVNKKDEMSRTPLHIASRFGFTDVVRWLLSKGSDANAVAYNQFTPLHFSGNEEIASLLIKHGANLEAVGASGTALKEFSRRIGEKRGIVLVLLTAGARYDILSASYLGDPDRVRALLEEDPKRAKSKEVMRIAAREGRLEIVKILLERGADPKDADYWGLPVLYFAVRHPAIVKALLEAGADPKAHFRHDCKGVAQDTTALHWAAQYGAVESARVLLNAGADVNARNALKLTPLHNVGAAGYQEMVRLFLDNGGKPNVREFRGFTPIGLAARNIRPREEKKNKALRECIRILGARGAEVDLFSAVALADSKLVVSLLDAKPDIVDARNPTGYPALHKAVDLNLVEIVEILLARGGKVDIQNLDEVTGNKKSTPLHCAAFWGRPEIAKILIEHKADVNHKTEAGWTPLLSSARMNTLAVAKLLVGAGADINCRDGDGETPLAWACKSGEGHEMVRFLRSRGGKK